MSMKVVLAEKPGSQDSKGDVKADALFGVATKDDGVWSLWTKLHEVGSDALKQVQALRDAGTEAKVIALFIADEKYL